AVSKIPNALGEAAIFLLENLLFLPGIFDLPVLVTVSWSLSYELFFYLTLPLLVLLLKLRCWPSSRRSALFLALVLSYLAFHFVVGAVHLRLLMFASGILMWEAKNSEWIQRRLTAAGELFASLALLIAFVSIYLIKEHYDSLSFVRTRSTAEGYLVL